MICLRLVFLRKTISVHDWNICLNSGLTCKTCQCFSAITLILVKVQLHVIELEILHFTSCEVSFSRSVLPFALARKMLVTMETELPALKRLLETLLLAIKICTLWQSAVSLCALCVPIYIFGFHHKQCASD